MCAAWPSCTSQNWRLFSHFLTLQVKCHLSSVWHICSTPTIFHLAPDWWHCVESEWDEIHNVVCPTHVTDQWEPGIYDHHPIALRKICLLACKSILLWWLWCGELIEETDLIIGYAAAAWQNWHIWEKEDLKLKVHCTQEDDRIQWQM